jgi:hypothetical protein
MLMVVIMMVIVMIVVVSHAAKPGGGYERNIAEAFGLRLQPLRKQRGAPGRREGQA